MTVVSKWGGRWCFCSIELNVVLVGFCTLFWCKNVALPTVCCCCTGRLPWSLLGKFYPNIKLKIFFPPGQPPLRGPQALRPPLRVAGRDTGKPHSHQSGLKKAIKKIRIRFSRWRRTCPGARTRCSHWSSGRRPTSTPSTPAPTCTCRRTGSWRLRRTR